MRYLVIGNSHAACLIEAWRQTTAADRATRSGPRIDIFARPGTAMTEIGVAPGRVFAPTPAARAFQARLGQGDSFDLAGYDAIVVIGHELAIFRLVQIVARTHVLGWPCDNRADHPVITPACLREALAEAIDDTSAAAILRRLGSAIGPSGPRILVLPQPCPSRAILDSPGRGAGFRGICRAGTGPLCRRLFDAVAAERVAALGAQFLPQPHRTVTQGILTAEPYTTGARRLADLARPQAPEDVLHANAAYGRLLLDQIMSAARPLAVAG